MAFVDREVRQDGFTDAVLLGMGGSSLGPEVIRRSYVHAGGAALKDGLRLQVLDSTHPDEIAAVLDVAREHGVGTTMRGAGTSIAGNAVGTGLVLDFSRYLNRIEAIDAMVAVGAGLLWLGWNGFNGGDSYYAGANASAAVLNTNLATAGALGAGGGSARPAARRHAPGRPVRLPGARRHRRRHRRDLLHELE